MDTVRTKIEAWQAHIHAFVEPLTLSDTAAEAAPADLPLSGVTIGVKDIIDLRGFPTRNGSAACAKAAPAPQDAAIVAALREAGGVLLGKTTTTEFAFSDPTDCRNPHDLRRTPGGSSSGSAAAVAAGLVDIALGTQTAGSLCRPAAYCGAVGFKPGYGLLPMDGVTPLAPSFDTLGFITKSVDLAQRAFAVAIGAPMISAVATGLRCRQCLIDPAVAPSASSLAALTEAADAISGLGAECASLKMDVPAARIVADHRVVMLHEASQAHAALLAQPELLRPNFRKGVSEGAQIAPRDARAALERLAKAREAFWQAADGVDILLTQAVPDGAPLMDGTTGYQNTLALWTVFQGPLLSLPWGLDEIGRPRSVMLAAAPGREADLLAFGAALAALAPPIKAPALPKV